MVIKFLNSVEHEFVGNIVCFEEHENDAERRSYYKEAVYVVDLLNIILRDCFQLSLPLLELLLHRLNILYSISVYSVLCLFLNHRINEGRCIITFSEIHDIVDYLSV